MKEATEPVIYLTPPIHLQHYYSMSDPADKTIASCSVIPRHDALFVASLWVEGDQRHKHLGTALLARVVSDYQDRELYLTVASYTDRQFSDPQLIHWYERFGFELTDFPGGMRRPPGEFRPR
jgi:N-acetylglutamate synthase-like GNAT family acetyltransferase